MQNDVLVTPQVIEQVIDGVQYQVSEIKIEARQPTVWEILTDYDQLPQVFPIMIKSKTQSQNDCSKVLAQEVRPLPPFPAVPYVVRVTETDRTLLKWDGLTSYIKVNLGYFRLRPTNNGAHTFVTFAMRIEAPMLVPAVLIRQQLRSIMPQVLVTLKTQAETQG